MEAARSQIPNSKLQKFRVALLARRGGNTASSIVQ